MGDDHVSIVGGRGTSRRTIKKEDENWAGNAFKNLQEKRKEQSKNSYVTVGRGTSKIKFGDINTATQRPSGKGMWVSSGRGTGKRLIK
jgi:hypothetical protein